MTPTPPPPIRILLAVLLIGIAIGIMLGAAGTYYAVADLVEARADDGASISIDGRNYRITPAAASTGNLTSQNPYNIKTP